MAETFEAVPTNHFDANGNLDSGSRQGRAGTKSGETLVEWTKRFKSGRETFSGVANVDIVFKEAFPSAQYSILFGKSTATVNPIYVNKVATGFRITSAAAGIVDWLCVYDGPTE